MCLVFMVRLDFRLVLMNLLRLLFSIFCVFECLMLVCRFLMWFWLSM